MAGETVDIWQRLKRLPCDRIKICTRIGRLNRSVALRIEKLQTHGKKYSLLMVALQEHGDEFSEEEIELMVKLIDLLGEKIERLTEDITDLAEPTKDLFIELDEVEKQIRAIEAIVEAEVGSSDD